MTFFPRKYLSFVLKCTNTVSTNMSNLQKLMNFISSAGQYITIFSNHRSSYAAAAPHLIHQILHKKSTSSGDFGRLTALRRFCITPISSARVERTSNSMRQKTLA